jgi:hypothetical protein
MKDTESNRSTETEAVLRPLFEAAASHDDVQFIYTLIRVSGESYNTPDPLLVLQSRLDALDSAANDEALLSQYRALATCGAPLELLANLLRCARGEPYDMFPFLHLYSGELSHRPKPTATEMAEDITLAAGKDGRPELSTLVSSAYDPELLAADTPGGPVRSRADVQAALQACGSFLSALFRLYSAERLKYREWPRFRKLARFYVLELLVDGETGLYGVRVHFPNGESEGLVRRPDSTTCGVAETGPPVRFAMAALTKPPDEWRVGEKLLYQIGLPGRYNELGEWKPISYPGDYEPIRARAEALSPDPDVQGALFYIMCTSHWVVEFALLAPMELPSAQVTLGERFHLYRCPPLQGLAEGTRYERVYDGWWDLESIEPDAIRLAISEIGLHVNMMALAYRVSASWQLKYRIRDISRGCTRPSEDGLPALDSMLGNLSRTEDAFVLHAAIDWYNRGTSARNVFAEFLCYYIAMESVAIALHEGKADFGMGYVPARVPRKQRDQQRDECIARKYEELYTTSPTRFVEEAYSQCVVGLAQRVRGAAEHIFSHNHKHVKALFEERDGYSLSSMRSAIAHGRLSLRRREHEDLVWGRVGEMSRIAREFLMRLALRLGPEAAVPRWPQSTFIGVGGFDPRGFLVASQELLPNKDWRIRPEWFL